MPANLSEDEQKNVLGGATGEQLPLVLPFGDDAPDADRRFCCICTEPGGCAAILAGSTAMWGERTDDGSIDTEVWPDTCAAAERLWSSSDFDFKPASALLRLIPHRCRMYQRGIRAKSLDGT